MPGYQILSRFSLKENFQTGHGMRNLGSMSRYYLRILVRSQMMTETVTLNDFIHRPLTRRTEKFLKLCEFYRDIRGRYPESAYQVYDFIQDNRLPFELRSLKLLGQPQIISAFWKWTKITGYVTD